MMLLTDQPNSFKQLSAAEALRALYIDFEGRKDEPPVLLGVQRHGGRGTRPYVQQDVVDPVFAGLVPRYLPLHDCVENVVRRAEHGDRRIVSWSQHDLDVVRTLEDADPELVVRFEARYVNALAVAKRWRNRCQDGHKPIEGALANYLALIEYAVPDDAEPGHVGDTIRDLRPRLARGLPLDRRSSRRAGIDWWSTTASTSPACGRCACGRRGSASPEPDAARLRGGS